jgi:hypothetical protein
MARDIGALQSGGRDVGALQGNPDLTLTGSAGIPSAEAFGGDAVLLQDNDQAIQGGTHGIPSAEAFGGGGIVLGGDRSLIGSAGIASAETFGSGGAITTAATITGSAGIPSAEAFGANGQIAQQTVAGVTGIPSAEAFGSGGAIQFGISGTNGGIPSAEAFGTTGTVLRDQPFTLFIGHLDATGYVLVDTLQVSQSLNNSGTTAQFSLQDPTGAYFPAIGAEVVYYRGNTRYFGGTIEKTTVQNWIGKPDNKIDCNCNDWGTIASRRVIGKVYDLTIGGSLTIIAADIVNTYLAADGISIDLTGGDPGLSLGVQTFNWITVTEALNQLAKASGWDWRIDFYKVLRFFPSGVGVTTAPFALADNDSKWRNMTVESSRGQYRNRQYVRTSQQLVSNWTDTYSGTEPGPYGPGFNAQYTNGTRRFFVTAHHLTQPPMVFVDGVAQTVVSTDTLNAHLITNPTFDWFWIPDGFGVSQNTAHAALTSLDRLEVVYPSSLPQIVSASNNTEILARAAIEGNSGIYEAVEEAPDLPDLAAAQQLAASLLARYGDPGIPKDIKFQTDLDGLEVGQVLTINTTRPPVSGNFLIARLTMREQSKTYLRWDVNCVSGAVKQDWQRFYAEIVRRTKMPAPRNVEIATFAIGADGSVTPPFYVTRNASVFRDVSVQFEAALAAEFAFNLLYTPGFFGLGPAFGWHYPAGTAAQMTFFNASTPVPAGYKIFFNSVAATGHKGVITVTFDI